MPANKLTLTRFFPYAKPSGNEVNLVLDELENYLNGVIDPNKPQVVLPPGGGTAPPATAMVNSILAKSPLLSLTTTGSVVIGDLGGGSGFAQAYNDGTSIPSFIVDWGTQSPALGSIDPRGELSSSGFTASVTGSYYALFKYNVKAINSTGQSDPCGGGFFAGPRNDGVTHYWVSTDGLIGLYHTVYAFYMGPLTQGDLLQAWVVYNAATGDHVLQTSPSSMSMLVIRIS